MFKFNSYQIFIFLIPLLLEMHYLVFLVRNWKFDKVTFIFLCINKSVAPSADFERNC